MEHCECFVQSTRKINIRFLVISYLPKLGHLQRQPWNHRASDSKHYVSCHLYRVENVPHGDSIRCPTTADPAVPWNVNCSTPNVDLDTRLSYFSQWRGAKGNDGAGLWHLMSNCPTGSQVGIAWLGTLCQVDTTTSGSSSVSGTAVSTAGLTEWQVISHEMGHNFGAIVSPSRLDTDVFSDKGAYGE